MLFRSGMGSEGEAGLDADRQIDAGGVGGEGGLPGAVRRLIDVPNGGVEEVLRLEEDLEVVEEPLGHGDVERADRLRVDRRDELLVPVDAGRGEERVALRRVEDADVGTGVTAAAELRKLRTCACPLRLLMPRAPLHLSATRTTHSAR